MIWFKWILFVCFKLVIELPFIIIGPVAMIAYALGSDFAKLHTSSDYLTGCLICCLFSPFLITDLLYSILMPWTGGTGRTFPVWWEDAKPFARKGKQS